LFGNYEEAYTKLMVDLTALCADAIRLVIPKQDSTKCLYISGGFARNGIFVHLLKAYFPHKKVLLSEIDNSSALGAALVISGVLAKANLSGLDLGIVE
jgi:sugar (pentulose or hexulose) kinase